MKITEQDYKKARDFFEKANPDKLLIDLIDNYGLSLDTDKWEFTGHLETTNFYYKSQNEKYLAQIVEPHDSYKKWIVMIAKSEGFNSRVNKEIEVEKESFRDCIDYLDKFSVE